MLKPRRLTLLLKKGGSPVGNVSLTWPHAGVGQLGYLKRSGEVRDEFMWGMTRADWRAPR